MSIAINECRLLMECCITVGRKSQKEMVDVLIKNVLQLNEKIYFFASNSNRKCQVQVLKSLLKPHYKHRLGIV